MINLVKKSKSLNELANVRSYKFAVIAIDETEYWDEDIASKAGKIEGVYLVNLKEPTHLCELAVSYPAIQISNFFNNVDAWKENEDELSELERYEGIDGNYIYLSGNSTYNVKKMYKQGTFEDAEENERCNPAYC